MIKLLPEAYLVLCTVGLVFGLTLLAVVLPELMMRNRKMLAVLLAVAVVAMGLGMVAGDVITEVEHAIQ